MDKVFENFGDKLEKLAEAVDLLETTDITKEIIEVSFFVDEKNFQDITNFLGQKEITNKCVIEIGNTKFTFLKK